ncbi:GNAT family N-acetyltransferase [Mesorhizobium sp. M7A.F.Ca.MR.176.00.0.0]|nr:GNAT family N-acetyltransferase [Mesorhizobium sp. M7A.F.Ca.MR.176.00.0.0]
MVALLVCLLAFVLAYSFWIWPSAGPEIPALDCMHPHVVSCRRNSAMTSSTLALVEVDAHNWEACAWLKVQERQTAFVFTAAFSLAQCAYVPELLPFAVEVDQRVVGHIVLKPDDKSSWIHRVIIGAEHQGHGYGRAAVEAAIALLVETTACREIMLAVTPGNEMATRLYHSLGFVATGEFKDGDAVYCLALNRKASQAIS